MSDRKPNAPRARRSPLPAPELAPAASPWTVRVAVVGTLLAIGLRVVAAVAAGPLWRDEAGSASTAAVPTFGEFLSRQPLDSFPLLWQLLLRFWTTVAWNDGDVAIRSLGLAVALLLLPALWWTCRGLGVVPLASLLFAGIAPTFVVWAGVQNRAYGLGVALLALTIGAVWRTVQAPSAGRTALAALLAVLAVQTSYHNPVMLAALLGAAAVVAIRRRSTAVLAAATAIGVAAAASLVIYAGVLSRTRELAKVVYAKVSLEMIVHGFGSALAPGGRFVTVVFVVATVGACAWGWIATARSWARAPGAPAPADDAIAFAAALAIFAVAAQILLLFYLRFLPQPWYYVSGILAVAIAIDVVTQRALPSPTLRDALAAAVALALVLSTATGFGAIARRLSNMDLVAAHLKANALPGDLVVVYPWHYGVSFQRYYDGEAPFMTIPDVAAHDHHRFDQLADLMRDPELIKPGFRRIHQTLQAGNGVWVVGLPLSEAPPIFPVPPAARDDDPLSWGDGPYTVLAGMQLAWVLQRSSPAAEPLPPLTDAPVSDYEDASITLYRTRRP